MPYHLQKKYKLLFLDKTSFTIFISDIKVQSASLYFCYSKELKALIPAHNQKNK